MIPVSTVRLPNGTVSKLISGFYQSTDIITARPAAGGTPGGIEAWDAKINLDNAVAFIVPAQYGDGNDIKGAFIVTFHDSFRDVLEEDGVRRDIGVLKGSMDGFQAWVRRWTPETPAQ